MTLLRLSASQLDLLVGSALQAYREDVSLVEDMIRQAKSIQRKRAIYDLRAAVKRAEAQARETCQSRAMFVCRVAAPCGTGACPFADPDLAHLQPVPTTKGKLTRRPQPSTVPLYSIESVIYAQPHLPHPRTA